MSDSVVTWLSSEYFWVTKNALVSVAADGLSSVIPAFFSSGWALSMVFCGSETVIGLALAPL